MSAPVLATPVFSGPVAAPADAPLSVQAADYHAALDAGAIAVDLRSHRRRQLDGALFGALAIEAVEVLDRLTPGSDAALRVASLDAQWVLISEDGHEAEWFAWHLQARGITGARFVVGGHRRLRASGIFGQIRPGELDIISVHDS